ncbi:helix-turn-helix domain-containing protein [Bacteroides sp. An19]|uniref:helix-turn-helix domain-containing protein n=1 Tax=Bacteroides sp. An19 TaxID=1965580 RepID=UPI000B371C0E|nr:helix-turn-helix domain-containing protein [Bacteroides sp. An19]OUP32026.1 hypothetical protein B5F25_09830 [Bacteroides sp. An19]
MKTTITQRIKELIDFKEMSINSFSKKINIVQTTLNRQINGDTSSIPVGTIEAILHYFPEISAEWLLRGEGEMIKGKNYMPKSFDAKIEIDNEGCLKIKIK